MQGYLNLCVDIQPTSLSNSESSGNQFYLISFSLHTDYVRLELLVVDNSRELLEESFLFVGQMIEA
jgi:hypothetical protein